MKLSALIFAVFSAATLSFSAVADIRIRDIVDVEGTRENDLVGYGIVVGLNGTGDTVKTAPFTEDSLSYMLERLGVNVQGEEIKPKNVDAVLVTATLPSFARSGSNINVTVASIGDAKSLVTHPAKQLVLYGQSVGSGPSCFLAARHDKPIAGLMF